MFFVQALSGDATIIQNMRIDDVSEGRSCLVPMHESYAEENADAVQPIADHAPQPHLHGGCGRPKNTAATEKHKDTQDELTYTNNER